MPFQLPKNREFCIEIGKRKIIELIDEVIVENISFFFL